MKQLLLSSVSVIGLILATWAAQPAAPPKPNERLPHHFGAIHPRVSEDGRSVAFSYQGAIWRMRPGGEMVRLTKGTGYDIEPAWSPDGKLIAYVSAPRMGDGALQIIQSDSGEPVAPPMPVQVVDIVSNAQLEFHPDGRVLGNFRINGQNIGLALLDLKTGQTKPLLKPLQQTRFALSKDGRWLAHTTAMDVDGQQWGNNGPQADIFKTPTDGGESVRLTRFRSKIHDLCWSADGTALYLVSELGGAHYDIWHLPVDNPERARRITWGQADEDRPSVSKDGRGLVFTDNRDGCTSLVSRDLVTGIDTILPVETMDFRAPTGRLTLRTREAGKPIVARVSLQQVDGKFFAPPGALHRVLDDSGHFYCDGEAVFTVPTGEYRLRAFHGPEFRATHLSFTVEADQSKAVDVNLERWTDPAKDGWYSGENHIHANYGYGQWYCTPATMLEQCAGENLRVCNFMVANSDTDGVFDREFFRGGADPLSTPETVLAWNQEFRSTIWGHMTLVDLDHLVEPIFTGFHDTTNPWDIPTNADVADRTHLQKGLVNYTHSAQNAADPYLGAYTAKGLPVDVALGKIDTLDLNASYAGTVPLWYRLLNCGFRLPPSAGTDVFLNRIRSRLPGGDRVYVKVDGPFSYDAWIDGLKAGRSFVTSGPMLELRVEDQGPGGTLKLAAPREVKVVAKVTSQFPLTRVELVRNGQVIETLPLSEDGLSAAFDKAVSIPASSWLSLRASGKPHPDHTGGPLEAHASPVFVHVGERPIATRADAEYFLAWIERLSLAVRTRERIPSPELRQHVDAQLEAARAVYEKIARDAR